MTAYCTVEDVRLSSDIDRSELDGFISTRIAAAQRKVNAHCGRTFEKTTTATQRKFRVTDPYLAYVDDFYSTTGLVIATDSSGDGTTDTTWTTSDYELEPLNQIVNGNDGWPYFKIRGVYRNFPTTTIRPSLYVTALWGWESVPDDVVTATTIVAAKLVKFKDTPLGVAGIAASGFEIRVKEIPEVVELLSDYVRSRP